MNPILRGRVWCVGDDINTDLILPVDVMPLPRKERTQHVFRANRPNWAAQVRPGDLLVAGRNFGMGSGRPTSLVMKDLGLACVLAESLNGLFLRNCVNFALPALEVQGVRAVFVEGDWAEVDFPAGTIVNLRTGVRLGGAPWPAMLLAIWRAGGLDEKLEAEGLLHPQGWRPPMS